MPWLERTAAVIEAWYPGQKGGEAIAEILSGDVNPSGRLPVTFPAGEDQLPHPRHSGGSVRRSDRAGRAGRPLRQDLHRRLRRRRRRRLQVVLRPRRTSAFPVRLWPVLHDVRTAEPQGQRERRHGYGERDRPEPRVESRRGGRRNCICPDRQGDRIPLRLAGWSRIELAPGRGARRRRSRSIRASWRRSTRLPAAGGSPAASIE